MFKKKKKRLAVVRIKRIDCVGQDMSMMDICDGPRYNNVNFDKLIKYLTITNIRFRVGMRGNRIIANDNYIEVFLITDRPFSWKAYFIVTDWIKSFIEEV